MTAEVQFSGLDPGCWILFFVRLLIGKRRSALISPLPVLRPRRLRILIAGTVKFTAGRLILEKREAAQKDDSNAMPVARRSKAKSTKSNPCWPGFEPVSGKKTGTKGSCKKEAGEHPKATRRATQKAAAASKLEKAGKTSPDRKK
jgi:hypothetical protein